LGPRIAFVFPGQGSQHPGMLDEVPDLESLARLLDAAEALSDCDLRGAVAGPAEGLTDTMVAQPLLYLTDWAWGVTLQESGLQPGAVAGHSLGEFAALAIAGVFSPEAGLELVVERARIMSSVAARRPGAMAAVLGLAAEKCADAITSAGIADLWIANDNSPTQIVITGASESVEAAREVLSAAGARRVVPLAVSGAFHSPMMQPAADAFAEILAGAEFDDARIPVYQNTDPTPETDGAAIRERLIGQISSPVRWTETMTALSADGPVVFVESGPGSVLSGLAKRMDNITAVAVEEVPLETIVEEVAR
jgi:[acyl-carrier-protein] S-malonyltransferase